jgi:hypothetical protein
MQPGGASHTTLNYHALITNFNIIFNAPKTCLLSKNFVDVIPYRPSQPVMGIALLFSKLQTENL